jgi:putative oxidoreductase
MAVSLPRILRDSTRVIDTDWASLLLRLVLGSLMLVNHGLPKWQGFAEKSQEFYNFLGLGSSTSMALAVFAEVICSILILIGLATRWAIIPLVITMLVALLGVHIGQPLAKWEGGLTYLFGYVALFLLGSGRFSVDAALRRREG